MALKFGTWGYNPSYSYNSIYNWYGAHLVDILYIHYPGSPTGHHFLIRSVYEPPLFIVKVYHHHPNRNIHYILWLVNLSPRSHIPPKKIAYGLFFGLIKTIEYTLNKAENETLMSGQVH